MIDLNVLRGYSVDYSEYSGYEMDCRFSDCYEPFRSIKYWDTSLGGFLDAAEQHETKYHTNG